MLKAIHLVDKKSSINNLQLDVIQSPNHVLAHRESCVTFRLASIRLLAIINFQHLFFNCFI